MSKQERDTERERKEWTERETDRDTQRKRERESAGSDSMTSFRLRTVINLVNMLQPSNHRQKIEAFHHKKIKKSERDGEGITEREAKR